MLSDMQLQADFVKQFLFLGKQSRVVFVAPLLLELFDSFKIRHDLH